MARALSERTAASSKANDRPPPSVTSLPEGAAERKTLPSKHMRHDIDTGASAATPVSAAGPLAGTFDTSTPSFGTAQNPHDFTLYVSCTGLAAGATARVAVEDSILGTFADALPLAVFHFAGPISKGQVQDAVSAYNLPAANVAAAASKLRVNVLQITADGAGSFHAQIETT